MARRKPETLSKAKLAFYIVSSTLLITFSFYGYQICFTPNVLVDKENRTFRIEKGTTYRQVLKDLYDKGFINDAVSFGFLARLKDYDKRVHPGQFALERNMTNLAGIAVLMGNDQVPVRVTFNNIRLVAELGPRITKNTTVTPQEFDEAVDRFVKNNQEGFTKENILSMFIPNTYEVYFNITADELVQRMHEEYEKFWTEERKQKAQAIGLTPIQVNILASIVRAEASKEEEAPIIAGLYLNRLKRDIALQADPTLVFAVGDFSLKRVLNVHKEVDSPYNTYTHTGLPPGPINMPGILFINSVLNAEQHGYIYMCAKEDFSGAHNFATNLTDHNRNAAKYQKALSIEIRKGREARREATPANEARKKKNN
ncbi:MAG TPA: endolytic transglycosylase MltG [Cyclobacteriaceae bacterium]|nr:endolytic transglycosylase MltG [Cyclobacteriaceae bacterium]